MPEPRPQGPDGGPPRPADGPRRQDREREFHDRHYGEAGGRGGADRFYEVTAPSTQRFTELVEAAAGGRDCLEYGCASGELALQVAERAHSVVGFDISPVVIEQARSALADAPVPGAVSFEVAEAEALPFADRSFDLAFGAGVLHHLDLVPTLDEMRRVLRPDGRAVFVEPMGHNPAINWYRRRTPGVRTPDEHPLVRADLEAMAGRFETATVEFFHLATLAAVALTGHRAFEPTRRALSHLDAVLLAPRSPLRWWSWVCVVQLAHPRP